MNIKIKKSTVKRLKNSLFVTDFLFTAQALPTNPTKNPPSETKIAYKKSVSITLNWS